MENPASPLEKPQNKKRLIISTTLSVGVSALLLGLVLTQIDFGHLATIIVGVDLGWMATGFVAFIIYQLARAFRTSLLLEEDLGWATLFPAMCLSAALRKILPAWLGEAALIAMLWRLHKVRVAEGTAVLLVSRLIDLALLGIAILAAVLLLATERVDLVLGLLGLMMVFIVGGVLVIVFAGRLAPDENGQDNSKKGLVRFAMEKIGEVAVHSRAAAKSSNIPLLILYSSIMWLSMMGAYYSVLTAMNSGLDLTGAFWLYVLLLPVSLLPLRGFADLGTHEASWVIALALLGRDMQNASALAVGSHALFISYVLGLFAIGLIGLTLQRKSKNH